MSGRPTIASMSAMRRLIADGRLDPTADTVVYNTGDGLKTLDAVADHVSVTATVRPRLDEALAALVAEGPTTSEGTAS